MQEIIFPTEVETARYDGLYPGVCYGDGKGNFTCKTIFIDGELQVMDVRDIQGVLMGSKPVYVFAINDGPIKAFTIR